MDYRIFPPEELIEEGVVTLPQSKSILNRHLLFDLLSSVGQSGEMSCMASSDNEADDIRLMRSAVNSIAAANGGDETEINIGESGTALRLLCAAAAARPGCNIVLTGNRGLLHRPVGSLVDALRSFGAKIDYLGEEGFAPLHIVGHQLSGGEVEIDAAISSQFVSALLLIAPQMTLGLKLKLAGEPASLPYIKMTVEMMRRRGIDVEMSPVLIDVKPGVYSRIDQAIEADWSAAAFWCEVVALTAGWITVVGESGARLPLPDESIQGDASAARFFEALGVVTQPSDEIPDGVSFSPSPDIFGRLDLDLCGHPDLAPALTVTCCLLGVPFKLTGLKSLSIKETDRLTALVEEMDKIGCPVEKIRDFGLEWDGKRHPIIAMPEFDSRGDHRLAMAFAPIAAYIPGIVVKGIECVAKSYPGYWDALRSLGFKTEELS